MNDDWQEQQLVDNEERRREVETVLNDYLHGRTSYQGLLILCRECGIKQTELTKELK